MRYLIRDGKIEFSGNKKQLIEYVREAYADDYWVQEYGNIFDKDSEKFRYATECIGLHVTDKKPKNKH
jgi:hypothetical protein